MPQVESAKHKQGPSMLLVAGAVIVVVAIVVAVLYFANKKPVDTRATSVAVADQAQLKLFRGKGEEAIAALKAQIAAARTDDEKLMLYTSLGSAYETLKRYPEALKAFQDGDKIRTTFGTNMSVGRLAEQTGDKTLALERYQAARKMIKDGTTQHHDEDLPEIEESIKRVGDSL